MLGAIPEEQRRLHHEALAIALEGEAPEETLARHWQGAGNRARAAEYARRAADDAIKKLDFDRGANLYRMALELGKHDAAQRQELQRLLGEALANAGRPKEAADAFLSAAGSGVERLVDLEFRRRSAEELLRGGYIDDGLTAIRGVLQRIGRRLARSPRYALISLLLRRVWIRLRGLRWREQPAAVLTPLALATIDICHSVATCLGVVDTIHGADYQTRNLLLALRLGEPMRVGRALTIEAMYLSLAGPNPRAMEVLNEAEAISDRIADPSLSALVLWAKGLIAYFGEGRWKESLRHLAQAERAFRRLRMAGWEMDTIQLFSCFDRLHLGELRELAELVPSYVREAERRGDRYFSVNVGTRLNIVHLMRDDVAGAEQDLEEAVRSWFPVERAFLVQHFWALHSRCELALYRGAPHAAEEEMARRLPAIRSSMLLRIEAVQAETLHLRARIALALAGAGDREAAAQARALAGKLARAPSKRARAWASLVLAGVAGVSGNSTVAAKHLKSAIESLQDCEMKLYAHAAKRRLGAVLGGDEGAALLAEADDWMTGQGIQNPARMGAMLVPGWSHPG